MRILRRATSLCKVLFSASRAFSTRKLNMVDCASNSLIGYVTDIEGNMKYWDSYLSVSKVVERVDGKLLLKENCQLVYGGDVCDRGSGDIRILSDLINLKSSYPDRVHFVLGNRDINKLRLPSALHPVTLSKKPRVYWVRKPPTAIVDFPLNDRVEKMKWMLTQTMGSPLSFDYRRQELIDMKLPHSDDDVVDSYEKLVDPKDGLLTRYMELGKICVVLGDVAFTHGAFHDYNMGWVPTPAIPSNHTFKPDDNRHLPSNSSAGGAFLGDFAEWVKCINDFAHQEILDYKAQMSTYLTSLHTTQTNSNNLNNNDELVVDSSSDEEGKKEQSDEKVAQLGISWDPYGGYTHPQPGSRLIQYGMGWLRDRSVNPSVIYSSYLENGSPVRISDQVSNWLKLAGVKKVVVGHQPNGDSPFVMSEENDDDSVQVISGDTSYSRNTQWPVSQLQSWFGGSLPVVVENETEGQSNSKPQPDWLSTDAYLSLTQNTPILTPNDTRNSHTVSEVLFSFKHDEVKKEEVKSLNEGLKSVTSQNELCVGKESKVLIYGRLSQQSFYAYRLHTKSVDMHTIGEEDENYEYSKFIGCKTSDGWYVKAYGVLLPNHTTSIGIHSSVDDIYTHATTNITSTERYFLLSFSEGHVFKNKLVSGEDIEREFL